MQAEPACWTKVWFAARCCWDMFGSGNRPQEVEGVARQSGMLGRAASAVTLSCGRGTRAGKQKESTKNCHFCSAEHICFPSHEEPETGRVWLQQQEALLCVSASSAGVSSALLSQWPCCGHTFGSFAVSLISPCCSI